MRENSRVSFLSVDFGGAGRKPFGLTGPPTVTGIVAVRAEEVGEAA